MHEKEEEEEEGALLCVLVNHLQNPRGVGGHLLERQPTSPPRVGGKRGASQLRPFDRLPVPEADHGRRPADETHAQLSREA